MRTRLIEIDLGDPKYDSQRLFESFKRYLTNYAPYCVEISLDHIMEWLILSQGLSIFSEIGSADEQAYYDLTLRLFKEWESNCLVKYTVVCDTDTTQIRFTVC